MTGKTPEIIALKVSFFGAAPGDRLKLIEGSRDREVCDVCGNKRDCYWYEPEEGVSAHSITGMDVCWTCARSLGVEQ